MKIDLILQGKGGVGKSLVATLLAQHYLGRGLTPICVDTDPVNATFAGYQKLGVERLDIMEGEDINPRQFDVLIERILKSDDPDAVMVVDNGAATFVPLCSYLVSTEALPLLADSGQEVRLHTIVTGGQALEDTFKGLTDLARHFPDTPIVVWLNEFFGPLERNGVRFEKSAQYKDLAKRITAQITLPAVRMETFGYDLKQMLSARLTFEEALASEDFSIMARQRLKMIWRTISAQMDRAQL